MQRNRDSWVFALTLAAASAVLLSIAGAETLLAAAVLGAIIIRPAKMVWPSYAIPLAAFMATTVLSLMMSPEPGAGMAPIRKFVLFTMGLLTANFITTPWRARTSHAVLLSVAAATSVWGLGQ